MSIRMISREEAGQYLSGLAQDGWEHLSDTGVRSSLERLESKHSEQLIIPGERRIFLFVLSGTLRVDTEQGELRVGQGEAVEGSPGTTLYVRNTSKRPVQYLLICAQPADVLVQEPALDSSAEDGMIRAA